MSEKSLESSFEKLLSEHRRGLKAYLLTIVQDYHLAEDILQDTSAIVAERWELEEIHDFWAFSREVARRQALLAIRNMRHQPVPVSEDALDSVFAAFEDLGHDPSDSRIVALQGCMKKLPQRWLKILDLRYWKEEKVNSIALKLNIHANVVSVTINRAKSKLADCVSSALTVDRVKL
ncbi:MAG: hypothetical protein CMO55_26340 [Verrucomicrobiales bacterium]|nr:hypothetical protein [Verrucomicrobiales bacterium]